MEKFRVRLHLMSMNRRIGRWECRWKMHKKLETIFFSHPILIRLASNEINNTHLWPCGGEEKQSRSNWAKLADSRVKTITKVFLYFLCCFCCWMLWAAAAAESNERASRVLCGPHFFIQRVPTTGHYCRYEYYILLCTSTSTSSTRYLCTA